MEMKHKIAVYTLVLILLVFGFSAAMMNPTYTGRYVKVKNLDDVLNNMDQLVTDYNNHTDKVPGFVKSIFGYEIINATIKRNDWSVIMMKVKTDDGRIVSIENVTEPTTLMVTTSESTFDRILNSTDQMQAFKDALDNKEIEYHGVKFTTKMKTGIAGIFFKIGSWFF